MYTGAGVHTKTNDTQIDFEDLLQNLIRIKEIIEGVRKEEIRNNEMVRSNIDNTPYLIHMDLINNKWVITDGIKKTFNV